MIWITLKSKVDVQPDHYVIGDKTYPRMTRVLDVIAKPEFYRWYAKNGYEACQNIMDDRAAFGTRCHKEFEHILNDEPVWVDNSEMDKTVRDFKEWKDIHDVRPLHTELTLHNDDLGIAGTADFIGFYEGKKYLLDWKTSRAVYDNYLLQVSGYAYMYEQATGDKLDGAGVVFFRDGKHGQKLLTRTQCEKHLDVLRAVVQVYNWKYHKGIWERKKRGTK